MPLAHAILRRTTAIGMWGALCVAFSFFVASGKVFLGLLILAAMLILVGVLFGGANIFALIWFVGSPTIFGFPNQVLNAVPFVTMERTMFVILAGLILLRMIFEKGKQPRLILVEVLILLFLAYATVSLFAHTTPERMRQDVWFLFQYIIPMATFLISRRIVWRERQVRTLLICLTATGIVLAIIGTLQVLFNLSILAPNPQEFAAGQGGRAFGTFTNAHTYIATLVIFVFLTFLQYNLYREPMVRMILLLAIVLIVGGILLGQTRSPWMGGALTLLIIFIFDKRARPILLTGGAAALFVGLIAIFAFYDVELFLKRVTTLGTMYDRLANWATAVRMIAHNPVFGVGFGYDAYILHKSQYYTGVGSISVFHATTLRVPHNEFLHVTVLLGLPGLILFISIIWAVIRHTFAIHRNPNCSPLCRQLALYVGAMIIGLLVNSSFSDTFLHDYFWALVLFLAGLVASMAVTDEQACDQAATSETVR